MAAHHRHAASHKHYTRLLFAELFQAQLTTLHFTCASRYQVCCTPVRLPGSSNSLPVHLLQDSGGYPGSQISAAELPCFTTGLSATSLHFVVNRSWVCDHPFIRPGPLFDSLGEMVSLLFSSLSTGIGSVTTLLSAQYHCRTESDDTSPRAADDDAAPGR